MPPEASPHPAPLAELLGRISAELADLAAAVERLHPLAAAHARQTATPTTVAATAADAMAKATPPAGASSQTAATTSHAAGASGQLATATPDAAPPPNAATPHAAPDIDIDIDYVGALQDLDNSEQKLRALAGFLADLARAADPAWRLDPHQALAAITLSDLAARLAGAQTNDTTTPGDIELF